MSFSPPGPATGCPGMIRLETANLVTPIYFGHMGQLHEQQLDHSPHVATYVRTAWGGNKKLEVALVSYWYSSFNRQLA